MHVWVGSFVGEVLGELDVGQTGWGWQCVCVFARARACVCV
jgi:hypothetical protein